MAEQFQDNLDQYVPEDNEVQQKQDLGNRVKYQKLVEEQWLRLEQKNFSQFELRVLDTLQILGNKSAEQVLPKAEEPKQKEEKKATKVKKGGKKEEPHEEKKQEDLSLKYEVCVGEEIYVSVIRQKLLEVRVVSKMSKEEEEEDEEDEEATKASSSKQKPPKKSGSKKKGTQGAMKKEDIMRLQLSRDKVLDSSMKMLQMMGIFQQQSADIKLIEEEFLRVEQAAKRIKSLKWLEMKFAALLVYSDQIIKTRLPTKVKEEYAFELIYFLKNVYLKYKTYNGASYLDTTKSEVVSSQVMKDVRKKLGELHKIFHFSNRMLFNRYPRLVIDTDLNQSFTQTDVKPYKAQVELLDCLAQAKKPLLVFLNTMVGTGKTVLSVAITQFLQKIRDNAPKVEEGQEQPENENQNLLLQSALSSMQILYCCPLDNVRTQVGSAAYQKKLQFAIASMWKDPKGDKQNEDNKDLGYVECPRIVNSYANKSQAFPTLIVSDFKTTLELLKEKQTVVQAEKTVIRWQGKKRQILSENPSKNGSQYILFIDEPTVDADFPDAETTKLLVQIMRYAPPITILSSATLPPPEKLPNFLKLFKKRYGQDVDIKVIQSQQFQIGCQIFSHDGKKFLPHYKAKDKESLKVVLKRLEQNPFMQRCYNANAYCELYDRMKRCGLQGLEDFEEFDLITQEIVQQKSIDLLNRLLEEDVSVLQKVCKEILPDDDEEDNETGNDKMQFDLNDDAEDDEEKRKLEKEDKIRFAAPYKKLRLRDLAGKMAHKFSGGCLITVNDPIATVRQNFSWLLKDTKPAQEYIKQYEKNLEVLQRLKEKKEKEIDNEDERSRQIQEIEENMKISIDFPDFLKINTLEHYKKFVAGSNVQLLNSYRARKAFSLEGINLYLGIPDDILLYLFSGIATYTEKQTSLSPDYYEEVQNLASNGQLALIISDDSMCYGVNYPLNHVIVYDEMADRRSMGALFQLIGRAGRVGVSWVANAYLQEETFNRLVNYLEGESREDEQKRDEAYNMELLAKQLYDDLVASSKARRAQLQKQQE